jgi:hypothetical protein
LEQIRKLHVDGDPMGHELVGDEIALSGVRASRQQVYAYLDHVVNTVRYFCASNERDKIYAALGMAQHFKPEGVLIVPDYK